MQCLTGGVNPSIGERVRFLDYVLGSDTEHIVLDVMQSEEGGRFYQEENRNLIIKADDGFPSQLPENFIWLTLNQLQTLITFNNYLNIQARSLIAMIPLR